MKRLLPSLLVFAFLGHGALASASPILGGPTGLVSPDFVITFDELGNLQSQVITNQFTTFGVTVTGAWWDNANLGQAGSTGFAGGDLVTGTVGGQLSATTIVLSFGSLVTGAAFAAVDQGGSFTVSSFVGGTGGTLVETFNTAIPTNPGIGFLGFQNSLFDTISITPAGSSLLSIDTLQVAAVPEPATLLLLGTGLGAVAARRRLKKRA